MIYHFDEQDDDDLRQLLERIEKKNRLRLEASTPKWYNISHNSFLKEIWDAFIILLAVYNGIFTPLQISFPYIKEQSKDGALYALDMFINVAFFIDILVGFTTSYID